MAFQMVKRLTDIIHEEINSYLKWLGLHLMSTKQSAPSLN